MSYDKPHRMSYFFAAVDFGTGADHTQAIPIPTDGTQGRSGRVTDIVVSDVTENFVGDTTDAGIQVGNGTDADKYYDTGLVLDETVDVSDNASLWLADDGSKVDIPLALSLLTVTFVQSVGGSITGIASVTVFVDWD
jgi:hypothetical protein